MDRQQTIIFFAWLTAAVATAGSLFFSDVMGFTPCVLCWYQRIFMYPLAIILFIVMQKKDITALRYVSALAYPGWAIAMYHVLLQKKIIPAGASPCVQGVPCDMMYINWFGFITIPVLSLTAFTIIIGALIYMKRNINESTK